MLDMEAALYAVATLALIIWSVSLLFKFESRKHPIEIQRYSSAAAHVKAEQNRWRY